MNCFEFRRHYLADPYRQTADTRQHREECHSCTAFAAEQDRINKAVEYIVRVPVPTDLEARVLMQQSFQASRVAQRRASMIWRMAAVFVLGISISIWIALWHGPGVLADAVVSYVRTQPVQSLAQDTMSADEVRKVFQDERIQFQSEVVSVHYAMPCIINGIRAIYMVVDSDNGPVSVVVMPQQTVPERTTFSEAGYQGVIVRCQQGSVAIVGTTGQNVELVEKRMIAAMQWL